MTGGKFIARQPSVDSVTYRGVHNGYNFLKFWSGYFLEVLFACRGSYLYGVALMEI